MASDNRQVAFFEIEPWQQDYLAAQLPNLTLRFFAEPLDERSASKVHDVPLTSVFIRSRLSRDVLNRLPTLRFIATRSTGVDHIDLEAAAERGIIVSNVPGYGENTVAEHTFGLILSLSRKIIQAYRHALEGRVSLESLMGFDLKGKTLGVVGAGRIGLHVIRIARGFDMNVLTYDVRPQRLLAEVLDFDYVPLKELLQRSDIVTLHSPHTPETHHLMNRERFALLKRGALLINTARGELVDTDALLWALNEGFLAGAGLDVVEGEELVAEEDRLLATPAAEDKLRTLLRHHVLLRYENVIITPHIAFYSREAVQRILDTTVSNICCFLAGHPENVVPGGSQG
ncbi:MAG: hydroxyacid dehydrogenase [Chloroflexota bacterium]|nr:MAG: hydroxyacid dehydrogenase [Chloroflexota bacterium]